MKHENFLSVLLGALSAAVTLAAPSHFHVGLEHHDTGPALAERTTTSSESESSGLVIRHATDDIPLDDSNCVTWTDGLGELKCNQLSIHLGHPNLAGIITKNYLFIYMLNITNLFLYNPILLNLNHTTFPLPILEIKSALNCHGDQWKSVSSVLPWTIDFHGGNACNENAYNGPYDNTWINYAGTHVDVPTDKRCRWMDFVGFRCTKGSTVVWGD
ncbi:hypothetical protein B0T20DRAFT_497839 [Sordaria brevicollis]|uniref:Uncharacterized protein n=1 Tax=Sordaria brevicollis TaxID=83679 RepID=A0AAE0PGS8_SORBR|nr:hypothetical protein B0T20DRAFT_497839 [Sordaria brevicollis]